MNAIWDEDWLSYSFALLIWMSIKLTCSSLTVSVKTVYWKGFFALFRRSDECQRAV